MSLALRSGSAPKVGEALSHYWERKKRMVGPEAEPETVVAMMQAVSSRLHGWSLAGAGGGGYVAAVMRAGESVESIRLALSSFGDCRVVPLTVADVGLIRTDGRADPP